MTSINFQYKCFRGAHS